jgi:hypothetical protein
LHKNPLREERKAPATGYLFIYKFRLPPLSPLPSSPLSSFLFPSLPMALSSLEGKRLEDRGGEGRLEEKRV